MARRRDSRLLIEIDTSGDASGSGAGDGARADGGFPDGGLPDGAHPEPVRPSWFTRRVAGPVGARWRGLPRRTRVAAVAGTLAVVLVGTGGVVVADVRADAARAAHIVTFPGGVADLSAPLEQTWELATDSGVLAVLDGGLLLTVVGTDALAVDAATGEVAWRQELGPMIECGTAGYWSPGGVLEPQASVTCLVGRPERSVVVIGADGDVVGRRDLGVTVSTDTWSEGIHEVATLTGDGGVAVGDQVYLQLSTDDPHEALEELEAMRADGTWRDPALRIEDPLTGEVRARSEIVLETAADLAACAEYSGTGSGPLWIQGGAYGDSLGGGASLSLCGKDVYLAADGSTSDDGLSGRGFPIGDWSIELTEDGSTLTGPDGEEFFVAGYVLAPGAADTGGGPFLTVTASGSVALAEDGTELWTVDGAQPADLLAHVDGTFVVRLADGQVEARDASTGEQRWLREADDTTGDVEDQYWFPVGSVTDGRTVLMIHGDESTTRLVALDLADGRTLWESELDAGGPQVLTVDGHVVVADTAGDVVISSWQTETVSGPSLRGYAVP